MRINTSLAAMGFAIAGFSTALAAVTPQQAALLKTTLTPMGAERAGSADGLIPPWTGGLTTVPAGMDEHSVMPDFFASDAKIVTIDASNMAPWRKAGAAGFGIGSAIYKPGDTPAVVDAKARALIAASPAA